MLRVLFVIVIGIALSGCELAQPYAALSNQPTPQPTATAATQPPTATATAAACAVSATALNLRYGPGLAYGVKAWPTAGEILTLTGKARGAWAEVRTAQNITGWINSNYCKGK
jgi:uncharacterized protein YgiM (DUF1202 family)